MLVIVSPGQGAQTPGFLAPWLELPGAGDRLTALSEAAGTDLTHAGTEADADTIKDTSIAQPLLVAAALLSAEQLLGDGLHPDLVSGHSVGELAAAGIAGVLSSDATMTLVGERGRAMAEAAAATPTGMTAVVGGVRDDVLATLDRHGLTPANDNGPGQVVAAGTLEQLQALQEDPPARARLVPLSVAGAFHTEHMAPAVERLRAAAAEVEAHDPTFGLISNRDGAVVTGGSDAVDRLVGQVANPVRWDLCMETMAQQGVTGLLELAPAGTLAGIAKRGLKEVERFALNDPSELDDAREFCRTHATGGA